MSVSERSCLDVLSVMGLLPDWEVDDFTTAMIAAIAVSRPVERLRLLGLYPLWVYYTSVLQDEGPERLLVIADLAEV